MRRGGGEEGWRGDKLGHSFVGSNYSIVLRRQVEATHIGVIELNQVYRSGEGQKAPALISMHFSADFAAGVESRLSKRRSTVRSSRPGLWTRSTCSGVH